MCSHLPLIYTRLIALSFGARAVDNDSIAEAQAQAALLAAARVTAIESTREAERGEAKEEEESKNEIEDKRGPAAEEEEKGEQADAVDEKKRGRKLLARPIPEGGWFGNFFLCFLCFLFFFFVGFLVGLRFFFDLVACCCGCLGEVVHEVEEVVHEVEEVVHEVEEVVHEVTTLRGRSKPVFL